MTRSRALFLVILLAALPAVAQWSSDPAQNLAIADRASEQVIPKIDSRADGGCYVGWFDLAAGSYDVYLQRLDAMGNEQWAHNGVLVSDHTQNSWLVDWDLLADSAGNAVLVFADARDGSDFDIHAYKVAPDGSMLWGADGITLSDNNDFEAAPRVAEASDGDLVFVWGRSPDVGYGGVMMQRIAPDGTVELSPGGMQVVSSPGETPGFCDVAAAGDGSVIVSWLRDLSGLYTPKHLRAERFSSTGTSLWGGYVDIYSAASLPIGYHPSIQSDGAGGALLYWHRSLNNYFNSFAQHLDADGTELFGAGGAAVSTLGGLHHIDPTLSYDSATGETYVFWNERNGSQSAWGLSGQKFSAAGARQWGSNGIALMPVNADYKYAIRSLPAAGGSLVFLIEEAAGWGQDHILGMRIDDAGDQVWPGGILPIASTLSGKSRLPVTVDPSGAAKLVWEDDRMGTVDVYGQNVNADGSLGSGGTAAGELPDLPAAGPRIAGNFPNPFNPRTTIRIILPEAGSAKLAVYDLAGRHLTTLADEYLTAGVHERIWDARDALGHSLPSGVYLARLSVAGLNESRKLLLID